MPTLQSPRHGASLRYYDGIVCFGGVDWWYHNRGHYDLQMMREFARHLPVLYVNSVGMRMPSAREGGMFARRVARKLRSFARGATTVAPNFTVMSPLAPPAPRTADAGERIGRQVRRTAHQLGIRAPLAWVACPPARHALAALQPLGTVFQRTDRFESFAGVDPQAIGADVAWLRERADVVLYCNRDLQGAETLPADRAHYVDHGIDLCRFTTAGDSHRDEPAAMAPLPRPRAGFIGGIDAHTFDPELLAAVAARLPEVQFVLVGGSSLPRTQLAAPNVHLMGRQPFEDVHRWMAACDVLLMPWRQNEWIQACNPVKLKEYLAVGRPIVSTPFPELEAYRQVVRVGRSADEFAAQVRQALASAHDPRPGRLLLLGQAWSAKAAQVAAALAARGLNARLPEGEAR